MTEYRVREVTEADATQLGTIHVAIWQATYAGLMDQAKLDALRAEDRIAVWRSIIGLLGEQESRGIRTRCAEHVPSRRIVGFATGGPARDVDAPATTQLWSLNVVPAHHGRGVASRLVDAVIPDWPDGAYLWVATGNARATAFYRKLGFEFDGAVAHDPQWDCHESRMLAPPRPEV